MIHPASHLALTVFSRAKGHSAVAAAAYRARASMVDHRRGHRFNYRRRSGLLSCEIVGWDGDREALWNAAEGREPNVHSPDPLEKRMAEALAWLKAQKAKRMREGTL